MCVSSWQMVCAIQSHFRSKTEVCIDDILLAAWSKGRPKSAVQAVCGRLRKAGFNGASESVPLASPSSASTLRLRTGRFAMPPVASTAPCAFPSDTN